MLVTMQDTKKTYKITLCWWDGRQWSQDVAGEILAGAAPTTEQELQWLKDDIAAFNAGANLEWMTHCEVCQECLLIVEEVQDYD